MFGPLLNTLLYIMLFADVLERRFPTEFQNFLVSFSYNCIYLFSRLQILLSQTNNRINTYIDSNPRLLKIKNDVKEFITPYRAGIPVMQEFIRNGKPIQLFKKGNTDDDNDYDFGTVSYFSDVDNCINTKIVYKGDSTDGGVSLSNTSNIKFILMELIIGNDKTFKIDLKTEHYNYNVVGNKLTSDFFIYYLRKHLNVEDEELLAKLDLEEDVVVKIIDHKVDTVEIKFEKDSPKDFIEIQKEGYGFRGTELNKKEIKESEEIELIE
jgi:hypothetical protein